MRSAVVAVVLVAACGGRATPSNTKPPEAGISIALYRYGETSYGVVDDRRWVDISGKRVLLGNIDPGASLASLVIEAANPALQIGPCTRERLPDVADTERSTQDALDAYVGEQIRSTRTLRDYRMRRRARPRPGKAVERFAPIVQCEVAGPPGRALVRIVYVSSTLSYRVQHDIELRDATRANIESRFAITTPPWRERASVVLFDGVPGGLDPPREIARGPLTLDGGTGVLVIPAHDVPAQLRRVFEGARFEEDDEDVYANLEVSAVWATLELPGVELAPGPIRVHVELDGEERWIDLPVPRVVRDRDKPDKADGPLRLRLWIDDTLRGNRQRLIVDNDGARMVEVVAIALTNSGDTPREVWVEEHARPAKRRRIERPWPKPPSASGDTVRNRVEVKPGRAARVGYTLVYEL